MEKKLTKTDIKQIRKLQPILFKIHNKQKVFFNITLFEKIKLTQSRNVYYIDIRGNKQRLITKHYLTAKGKRIMNLVL